MDFPVLLRNTRLSDDIAFRFANRSWDMYPLTADTWARWVAQSPGDVVNVFLDYETFGEHLWPETGIFEFLRHLPGELSAQGVSTGTAIKGSWGLFTGRNDQCSRNNFMGGYREGHLRLDGKRPAD